jgi:hypothetical protein
MCINPEPIATATVAAVRRRKNLLSFDGRTAVFESATSSDLHLAGSHNSNKTQADGLLTSWKDISAYLNRGVRTVQRWEQMLALPVHRIGVGNRAPVFAFKNEIDNWLQDNNRTSPAHLVPAVRVAGEHSNSHQRRLMQLAQEFREQASQLEQAIAADGSGPNGRVTNTLLTIQKLANAALEETR